MLLYPIWYRNRGIRRMSNLISPETHSINKLNLPVSSVLHYLPEDTVSLGISSDDILIKGAERMVFIEHITELRSQLGNPKKTPWVASKNLREYQRLNRTKLRVVTNREATFSNPRTLVVENYAPLQFISRYTTSFYSNYYKWVNIRHTLWKNANDLANDQPERHQFIRCVLPQVLPSVPVLLRAEKDVDRNSLEKMKGTESLDLLDVWQWLGKYRTDSPMGNLETKNLDKINLVFQHYDRWICLNLGLLNAWRATENEVEGTPVGLDQPMLQKRFLHCLVVLFESRTVVETPEEEETTEEDEDIGGDDDDDSTDNKGISGNKKKKIEPVDVKGVKITNTLDVDTTVLETSDISDVSFDDEQKAFLEEDLDAEAAAGTDYDAQVDKQLEGLDAIVQAQAEAEVAEGEVVDLVGSNDVRKPLEQGVIDKANELADSGMLSGAEYKRMLRLASMYKEIPNPYGKGTLEDHMRVEPESLKIKAPKRLPDNDGVFDKSMLQSSLLDFDRRYVTEVMSKDVINMVASVQNAGVAITGYEVEPVEDVLNHYEIHTMKLTPSSGQSSTIRFRIPKIHEDGSYMANGVRYSLRKQRGDMPIRKIAPTRVALTSYYGRVFVDRSAKVSNNYPNWLTNQIMAIGLDPKDTRVSDVKPSDVFDSIERLPKLYSTLARRFRRFTAAGIEFSLEYSRRGKFFGEAAVLKEEVKGVTVIGKRGADLVTVDFNDTLYVRKGSRLETLGKIEELLAIDQSKAPLEAAELMVYNKAIPVGMVLAYYLGLEKLIKSLKPSSFRRVQTGDRLHLADGEYAIRFSDESLVFHRDDKIVSLMMGGFDNYHKSIRGYSVYDFDRRDVYLNVLETSGIGVRFLRELDLLKDMFIDPITHDLLVDMKEPTEWLGLLRRSVELLVTDWAPAETDMQFMRIKGYERIAGAVYGEVVRSIRVHNARRGSGSNKVEMAPNAIWQTIQEDPSKGLVEESNPIECLRTQEAVTFGGSGGRSRRSMVKRSRVFHPNDMGVISEATVDSGDVAINTFLTADPNFDSLRGTSRRYIPGVDGATKLLSTAALISPCADRDDPKRVNFIGIQHHSSMFAKGYQVPAVRTGYEQVVAHRVDDMFAYTAKGDGKIVSVADDSIIVEYKNGLRRSVQLGRRFGTVAGVTFPHNLATSLAVGSKVKAGDIIAYNTNYFELDFLNPKQVLMKSGVNTKVAIMECADTLEDSSIISERIATELGTSITKIRDIVLTFDQSVRNLVKSGQQVDSEDILCTIEDAVSADNELFDEESLKTLKLLGSQTPKAKYKGIIEKVEVFYHGDKDDMTPTIKAVADLGDRDRAKLAKSLTRTVMTGSVDGALRIDGNPLNIDSLVIRIYVTTEVSAGVGDKGVFANQMKTIIGRVMSGENRTKSGVALDGIFGYQSISDRIVLSPELIGTTTTLLKTISKQAAALYKK